jgi:hypothetical protein
MSCKVETAFRYESGGCSTPVTLSMAVRALKERAGLEMR